MRVKLGYRHSPAVSSPQQVCPPLSSLKRLCQTPTPTYRQTDPLLHAPSGGWISAQLPHSRPSYFLSSSPFWPVGKVFSVQTLARSLLACGWPCLPGNHCPSRPPHQFLGSDLKASLNSYSSFLTTGSDLSLSCLFTPVRVSIPNCGQTCHSSSATSSWLPSPSLYTHIYIPHLPENLPHSSQFCKQCSVWKENVGSRLAWVCILALSLQLSNWMCEK